MAESAPRVPVQSVPLKQRLVVLVSVLVVVLVLDQASKAWAISELKGQTARSYLGGTALLTYAENPGAFGSLFGTLSDQTRYIVLTLGNTVLLAGVGVYLLAGKEVDRTTLWALSLILAGGFGNVIDRFRFNTVVIDFLYLQAGPLHTNVFNVADVAITGAFCLLVGPLLRDLIRPKSQNDDTANSTASNST